MAKQQQKIWRVKEEYINAVTVSNETQPVVLTESLTQEQLAALAEIPNVSAFLEQITQPVNNEG